MRVLARKEGNGLVFKRRDPMSWGAWLREQIYPRSGFRRATRYLIDRMTRLPDQPHKVARGVFAGALVGFLALPVANHEI